jgi:hypothetical protein
MVSEAIEFFKLNVAAYPGSFNPYDSLGEAYLAAGETEGELARSSQRMSAADWPWSTNLPFPSIFGGQCQCIVNARFAP